MESTEPTGTPDAPLEKLDSRARVRAIEEDEAAAVWVDRSSLKPWDRNPRKNAEAVKRVAASIQRFGFGNPILARTADREVIAGHTRLLAAEMLGIERVPVRFLDLDPADAHLLAVADNKLGEIAEWDDDELAMIMSEYSAEDAELAGFDDDELEQLAERLSEPPVGDDEADLTPPAAPLSVPGEVYELGPHRLVCGDSRSPDVWMALLPNGERARMVWTDPPYGVSYVGKTKDALTIQNDDLTPEKLRALLDDSLGRALAHSTPGAPWYVAGPGGPLGAIFMETLLRLDVLHETLIWKKDQFVMGRNDYHYRHEPIYYGWAPGAAHYWCGARDLDTILEFERPRASEDHPTMKPPELVQACMRNSSKPGWIVADPFGGSGTTLIAAAREGRRARLIELEPGYCDVIRRRWGAFARSANVDPGPGAL
jgi:site-specific DNA-methyltransferase (adenine-specific)